MKRVLALVAAVSMIVIAVAIRHSIDDNGSGDGSTSPTTGKSGDLVLACVTELQPVCDAIATAHPNVTVHVEDAQTTADSIDNHKSDADAWLTLDPWGQIASAPVNGQPVITGPTTTIATSPLGIAIWHDRRAALADSGTCRTVNWFCLGNQIGKDWTDIGGDATWGQMKAALPSASTAAGRLLLADAARSWFLNESPAKFDWASNDFIDTGFQSWLTNVEENGAADPLDEMLSIGPGRAAAVGIVKALYDSATGTQKSKLDAVYPASGARANVVLVEIADSKDARTLAGDAKDAKSIAALRAAHWDTNVTPAPATGLPVGGVLYALANL